MSNPPNHVSNVDSYAPSSLDANGQYVQSGYPLAHDTQYQHPAPVVPSLNGPYAASFGMPPVAFSAGQYPTANGPNGPSAPNGLGWNNMSSQQFSNGYYSLDPTLHLKLQSLPMLDNLAAQVIATFTKSSFPDIVNFVTRPDSDKGQAYATLKALFENTKRIYSRDHGFLNHTLLGLQDLQQQETIRKANLATFMSSIFGNSTDVNVYYLHNHFLDTFVPYGTRMLKWHAALFLELKTQAYISTVVNGGMSRDEMIQDLFPSNMEAHLLTRRPDAKQLIPSEQDFITRMNTRRYYLVSEGSLALLARKYDWTEFLKELSHNVNKTSDGSNSYAPRASHPDYSDATSYRDSQVPSSSTRRPLQTEMLPPMHTPSRNASIDSHDSTRNAALASQPALISSSSAPINPGFGTTPSPVSSDTRPQQSLMQSSSNLSPATETPSPILSEPVQSLYNRAHQSSASTPNIKNPTSNPSATKTTAASHPSPRRPWTPDEESALLAGLERVGGPHWSAILALYGAGGNISEVLKDRNQVQLKDKARNLKLWFLKSGQEVPPSLRGVTGELKTKDSGKSGESSTGQERKQSTGSSVSEGSSSGKRPSSTPSLQQAKRAR
ncbi:hypothetical protein EV356DRAFT_511288 [Viridothelium virens]|uniref:Uncharacterized protein n=1 Tax=Viridothelium virens TaxID=1048519 RepID=A0A6A6HQ75_VIRVR|nr:hypothetical protein EV356DRAFT_511288 [Viridothelium virens]